MANRTVKDARSIHGTNPQYLVEKIIRTRIYESKYWKEECFGLTAELVVDKAMELKFIGGVYGGNIKPTPFLCLILKMLQIQPEKDIVVEFIRNEDFKYVRLLGAIYMRLTGTSIDCFKYLEPLYNDYRKIKRQKADGEFDILHVDEFIDELLHEERACDIILPRIQKRHVLEETEQLEQRVSALDEDLDEVESSSEEEELEEPRKAGEGEHDISSRATSPEKILTQRPCLTRSAEGTGTLIDRGAPHHLAFAEVNHQYAGGADHQRGEALLHDERDIEAKVLAVIAVVRAHVSGDIALNHQAITVATDTGVTPAPQIGSRERTRGATKENEVFQTMFFCCFYF